MTGIKLKFIFCIVLYGTIGYFIRFISLPTEIVVVCRALIGSATILLIMKLRHAAVNREVLHKTRGYLFLSGICLGLNWVCLFAAYRHTTVAFASLCNYLAPIIVIIVAPLLLHEKLTWKKVLCVVAAAIGMVLVSGVLSEGQQVSFSGFAYGMGAAFAFVGIVIFNRKVAGVSFYERAVIQLPAAALAAIPSAVLAGVRESFTVDLRSVLIILMLGTLHTGVAYCFYFDGLARLPLTMYAVLGYLEPVVAVICSVVLLHEPMGPVGWIGTVLIIGAALASELVSAAQATGDAA